MFINGDIVFVNYKSNEFESAISKVELGYEGNKFNHVAIYGDGHFVEATPKGVLFTKEDSFFKNADEIIMAAKHNEGQKAFIEAKKLIGSEYNESFIRDDKKFYCSELIHYVFEQVTGRELFEKHVLKFGNNNNEVSDYWKEYYSKLGIEVPINELGSNPQNLSKSEIFHKRSIINLMDKEN